MRIFLKTLTIFFLFQLIKIGIVFIQQNIVNSFDEPPSINFIFYNSVLSKYLPVVLVFFIFLFFYMFKKNKENIIAFTVAFLLEAFLMDKYLFIPYNGFLVKMIINFLLYAFLLFFSYIVYYKFFGLPFKKYNKEA